MEVARTRSRRSTGSCAQGDQDQGQLPSALAGYELVELAIAPGSTAVGRRVDEIAGPPDCLVVAITAEREFVPPSGDTVVCAGESVILLAPTGSAPADQQDPISALPGGALISPIRDVEP